MNDCPHAEKPLAREEQGAGASVGRRRERVGPVVSRQPGRLVVAICARCSLKLIAPPGRVTQPITPAARIVAVLARHSQVGRMARATISAAQQVFQCSSIWPRSVVWSVRQHDVLSAVAATPLLLPEQKPFEIPCSARVHRCLHLVGAFMVRRRRLLISAAAGQHA